MNWYLRIMGASLVLLSAIILGRGYSAYSERAIAEYDGFLELLIYMKGKISCFLLPPSEIFKDFECEALERCGLLMKIRCGVQISDAFSESSHRLAIPPEAKRVLGGFFASFGSEYRDGEIARIEQTVSEIKRQRDDACELLTKKTKLAHTLLFAGALGLVIFLI